MSAPHRITALQARRFMLLKQGLIGRRRFVGEDGALKYVRQAGSIQFDPIDVCGRSPEIALNSRVEGFAKPMLDSLLYKRRELIDYFDKNLCIMPADDFPYFERVRAAHRAWERSSEEISMVRQRVRAEIASRGPLCAGDLDMNEKVNWYWSDTRLARAALEHMYFAGELAVHHKRGGVKYYDLIENCLPHAILERGEPYPDDADHNEWRAARRIGAVGLMWARASDAWLCMDDFKAAERTRVFERLCAAGKIQPLEVEGITYPLYMLTEDEKLLEEALAMGEPEPRAELIAPLDCLMWDRRLIEALFGFAYKWEIYTPVAQRKYGYYVLPILYGDTFTGRAEIVRDRKRAKLCVNNIWHDEGHLPSDDERAALNECVERFARFNDCTEIEWREDAVKA